MPGNCGSHRDNCKLMQGTDKGFREIKQLFTLPGRAAIKEKKRVLERFLNLKLVIIVFWPVA